MSLIYKQTVNAKLLECNSIISMFGNFLGNGVLLSFQRFELVRQLFFARPSIPCFSNSLKSARMRACSR